MPDSLLDRLDYDATRRRAFMAALPRDQFVLVAEDKGAIVGFCLGGRSRATDDPFHGEVYAIYVLPGHHGRGVGRALLQTAAKELLERDLGSMIIWVLRENAPSRRRIGLRLAGHLQVFRWLIRQRPADVGLRPLHVHLVGSIRRCREYTVERVLVRSVARRERRVDVLVLECRKISGVLRSNDGELALQRTHSANEVRGQRPVTTASGVRALPPALAH